MASEVVNVSIEEAGRNDTGVYATIDMAFSPKVTAGAGIRGDYVTSHNRGGTLATIRHRTAPRQGAPPSASGHSAA